MHVVLNGLHQKQGVSLFITPRAWERLEGTLGNSYVFACFLFYVLLRQVTEQQWTLDHGGVVGLIATIGNKPLRRLRRGA